MAQDMHDIILDLSQNILLEQPSTNKCNWQPKLVISWCLCVLELVVNTNPIVP
jgi:hypothetical protein